MLRNLFGNTLSHSSGSLVPSFRTMAFNLIANLSKDTVVTWELRNRYSTPTYPQGNGQAKAVNKVIMNGLKNMLDDAKGKMGGRVVACPLDIPNHTSQINMRDSLFNDLWSQNGYSFRD